MRTAERTVAVELLLVVGQERTQCPNFYQFVFGQRRQDAGQPLGEHRLACSRQDHQEAVSACGGDFQSKAGRVLTFHITQIRLSAMFRRHLRYGTFGLRQRFDTVQMSGDFAQRARAVNGNAAHHGGLSCVFFRQNKCTFCLHTLPRHRQRAAHGAQQPRQCQFPRKLVFRQLFGCNLPRCGKDADCNRQIETPRLFGQVGRGEVDGDFFGGEFKTALNNGGTDAVAAFLYFRIGQSDDVEMRQAVGKVGFHFDQRRIHTAQGAAVNQGKRHISDGLIRRLRFAA